jgi:uncharacterized protein (DUF1778 family)
MLTPKANEENSFSISASAAQKELLKRAAKRLNKSVSDFVLENALEAAEALELDNAHFVLSQEQYEAFWAELDKPPEAIPALEKLFSECAVNGAQSPFELYL